MPPHILVFPSPLNTIFDLAELLCLAGADVTFLLTPYTHRFLIRHVSVESRLNPYPNIHLHTISDELPLHHALSHDFDPMELLDSMETLTKPVFKDLLTSGTLTSDERGPVSCIVFDGFMTFVYDVAKEVDVPVISALSLSPCSLWVLSNLLDDSIIQCIPGMDGILTRYDLASMFQSRDWTRPSTDLCQKLSALHPSMEHVRKLIRELPRAHGLILNTFKALDEPILSKIQSICPNLYPIGPIHTHFGVRQEAKRMEPLLNYSHEENNNCITWLDLQQPKSVLYVNIENQAQLEWVQTRELWHGLVNSGKRFLWVRCPESILEEGRVPPKILKGTKERGCIVESASNVQVLAHKAIGGFLTCGKWDSIVQGIVEGVPIICCPSSLDQQVNNKVVSKAWKIELDAEWGWERNIIEKMIRDIIESKGELFDNANKMKNLGRKCKKKWIILCDIGPSNS